jgi:hypothetical protein
MDGRSFTLTAPLLSGLVLLLVPFLSLPWLPIGAPGSSGTAPGPDQGLYTAVRALPPASEYPPAGPVYTLHLVATSDAFDAVSSSYPDLTTDAVVVAEAAAAFQRFLDDLNGSPRRPLPSPALIHDLRPI